MEVTIALPEEWEGWSVTGELGAGAGSRVYLATHTDGSRAAVKVIPGEEHLPSLSVLSELSNCPGVVGILKIAVSDGHTCLMMPVMRSFAEEIRERKPDEGEMIRCLTDLAKTLAELNRRKLLHRDIKPENILIDEDGSAVLCDVDQARLFPGYDTTLTIQGSFSYMAPEVYCGARYDYRADLYSLGMVFYRCANGGRVPFVDPDKRFVTNEDLEEALRKRMKGETLPVPKGISAEFADILTRLCAADPKMRYQSADELLKDLELLKCGRYRIRGSFGHSGSKNAAKSGKKRKITVMISAVVIFLALCAGGVIAWLHSPIVPETVWSEESGVTFTIDRMGNARFSGEGVADDLMSNITWLEEGERVRKLIVGGGITEFSVSMQASQNLREVVVCDGVERLGRPGMFSGCTGLTKVTLPDSLLEIADDAFVDCSALTAIRIPENVKRIPVRCFAGCHHLSDVSLPDSLVSFGGSAFDGTVWMLRLLEENGGFAVINHCLIGIDRTVGELIIPDDLEILYLSEGLFNGDNALCSVVLPDDVEVIPMDCFNFCTSLSSVTLPGHLKVIDKYAFKGCASLTSLALSDAVDVSAGDIFEDTPYLESLRDDDGFAILNGTLLSYEGEREEVIIPEDTGIHTIAEHAFWGNRTLKRVVIPDSVKEIKQQAFFMCTSLEEVKMPAEIKEIGFAAFAGAIWQP